MVKLKTNTPKIRKKIVGSSSTIEGIEKIVNEYFYSENYKVDKNTLKITNDKIDNKITSASGFTIIKQGQKYKFVYLW